MTDAISPSPSEKPASTQRWLTLDHLLTIISALWAVAVTLSSGLRSNPSTVWVTGALLTINFIFALVVLTEQKRILIILNIMQIALFGLLHAQVYSALGDHHYIVDQSPGFFDWMQFTVVHVVRAVDLLDFLEEFGIDLQNVHHNSPLSGILLVLLHVTVGLFVFGVLVHWLIRMLRWLTSRGANNTELSQDRSWTEQFGQRLKSFRFYLLCGCLSILICNVWLQHWSKVECVAWMIDNGIRLVDVGDVMQVFHWRLHFHNLTLMNATLAVLFRLILGLYVAERIAISHLKPLPDLIQDLSSDRTKTRISAIVELAKAGSYATEAIPALMQVFKNDKDTDVKYEAAEALLILSEYANSTIVPDLVGLALDNTEEYIHHFSARILGRMGDRAASAIPHLRRASTSSDRNVRLKAAATMGRMVKYASETLTDLLTMLKDKDELVRQKATEALGRFGEHAWQATPELTQALCDKERGIQRSAAEALGKIGLHAAQSIPELLRALNDENQWLRKAAAEALGKIGPQTELVIPALTRALGDNDKDVRWSAAEALGRVGPQAKQAIPDLVRALANEESYICDAPWSLQDKAAVKCAAETALGKIDPVWTQSELAREAIPDLVRGLKNKNWRSNTVREVRKMAAETLEQMGPLAEDAISDLIRTLADEEHAVRCEALRLLKRINPAWSQSESVQEAIPDLIKATTYTNLFVRASAAEALGHIGPRAEETIPDLIRALTDKERLVRSTAATALNRINPKWTQSDVAGKAIPDLLRILTDGDKCQRKSATKALKKISSSA